MRDPIVSTDQQPIDDDTIMHCGHLEDHMHWFQYEKLIRFKRPDGTCGEAAWFVACQPCFVRYGEKVTKLVRGDRRWTGDAPVVEKVEGS